jgi:DNA helicase-2/ATP-dependent DNA helicase PcrA
MQWSQQQESIFGWAESGEGNLVVAAYAGTGKTTTMLEAARRSPESRILVCAFNKRIAEELTAKARDPRVECKTLHGLGFGIIRKFRQNVIIAKDGRGLALAQAVCGDSDPVECVKLAGKACTYAREMAPLAKDWRELIDIVLDFDLMPAEEWEEYGWNAETVAQRAYLAMQEAKKPAVEIDFTDMIFLPVAMGWARKVYPLVIVDEAQDMNACQLLLAQMVCKGRIAVVGDRHQAIYGFRGADSGSLDRLKAAYRAEERPLSITYRCPRSVVKEAQAFVPDYTAADSAPEGAVSAIHEEELYKLADRGDAVISRKNADLISAALRFIRAGKAAQVIGRDIAAGLRALVNELATGRAKDSIPELLRRLESWRERQVVRIKAQTTDQDRQAARIVAMQDKVDTLVAICEGAAGVPELRSRLERLFTDTASGATITCASVHRSKGLEFPRVFLLDWTFRHAHPKAGQEERNIRYVAVTRAQRELFYVLQGPPPEPNDKPVA